MPLLGTHDDEPQHDREFADHHWENPIGDPLLTLSPISSFPICWPVMRAFRKTWWISFSIPVKSAWPGSFCC